LEGEYDRCEKEITDTQNEIEIREAKYEDPFEAYDEVEHLTIKLDRDWQDFEPIAQSYIRNAASVHILCFACLEAHINMRAEKVLRGKSFGEFDRLPTTGKWLFYPKIVSVGDFQPGAEPFQGFQVLATRRNALVHYKTRVNYFRYGYEVPDFVDELGLRISGLRQSLGAVKGMVTRLAKMEKREMPSWIAGGKWDIFDMF
jgi:hypothetical protein